MNSHAQPRLVAPVHSTQNFSADTWPLMEPDLSIHTRDQRYCPMSCFITQKRLDRGRLGTGEHTGSHRSSVRGTEGPSTTLKLELEGLFDSTTATQEKISTCRDSVGLHRPMRYGQCQSEPTHVIINTRDLKLSPFWVIGVFGSPTITVSHSTSETATTRT